MDADILRHLNCITNATGHGVTAVHLCAAPSLLRCVYPIYFIALLFSSSMSIKIFFSKIRDFLMRTQIRSGIQATSDRNKQLNNRNKLTSSQHRGRVLEALSYRDIKCFVVSFGHKITALTCFVYSAALQDWPGEPFHLDQRFPIWGTQRTFLGTRKRF